MMYIRRVGSLGAVDCDPYWTEANNGLCSDSQGSLLNRDGSVIPYDTYLRTRQIGPYAPGAGADSSSWLSSIDSRTLGFVGGLLLIGLMVRK
jgi:hypothetical protein